MAAASTPPGAGRAEPGQGSMLRTPLAQGAEHRSREKYTEFSPTYDPRMDREPTLGAKLAAFDRKMTAGQRLLFERLEEQTRCST